MTMRGGYRADGKNFQETWFTRMSRPTMRCFIDGKPVSHQVWKLALAEALENDAIAARQKELTA